MQIGEHVYTYNWAVLNSGIDSMLAMTLQEEILAVFKYEYRTVSIEVESIAVSPYKSDRL